MRPKLPLPAIMDALAHDGQPVEGIAIDGAQLKSIRRARKIGRPKLAKLSGISERQIAKIEGSCSPLLSQALLSNFSNVLQVPVPVLTGEADPVDFDLEPLAPKASKTCSCCG
ncbi:MAG: helix-turn-helix transcriptional regulator [Pseudomonadota bacterium]